MKTKLKPLSLYFPISRVNDEERIVEGYAFVNETVPGEGGIKLKRSAMEAATEEYLANGTVRAMHQPIAAGKPLDVTWDEKGAFLRAKIVDDQEWQKVKENVYKGFSIGVIPKVLRGKDVTGCEWWDTSLVDRGKDKDALFSVWRSADAEMPAEVEVEIERASFNDYLEGCAPSDLRDMALDYLWNALWDIQWSEGTPEEKEALVRETCAEFTEFMVGAVATGTLPALTDLDDSERSVTTPVLTRFFGLDVENTGLVERVASLETAQSELTTSLTEKDETISRLTTESETSTLEIARVQGLLTAEISRAEVAEGRVKELEAMPARPAPARFPAALERSLEARRESQTKEAAEMKKELDELSRMKPTSDAGEADRRIGRISQLRRALAGIE